MDNYSKRFWTRASGNPAKMKLLKANLDKVDKYAMNRFNQRCAGFLMDHPELIVPELLRFNKYSDKVYIAFPDLITEQVLQQKPQLRQYFKSKKEEIPNSFYERFPKKITWNALKDKPELSELVTKDWTEVDWSGVSPVWWKYPIC
jgi:hypothetical protein